MQCTGSSGCFFWRYPAFFSLCAVFPYHRPIILRQMDLESLTCAQIWMRAVHMKGGEAQTNPHESWLGGTEKLSLTLPHQGIDPRAFGLQFRRSNHWATSPIVVVIGLMAAFIPPNLFRSIRSATMLKALQPAADECYFMWKSLYPTSTINICNTDHRCNRLTIFLIFLKVGYGWMDLFFCTLLSQWEFLQQEIRVAFPKESQLQQSRATQF